MLTNLCQIVYRLFTSTWFDYFAHLPGFIMVFIDTSRKRSYRIKVKCSECSKEVDSDYKREHVKRAHLNNQQITFCPVINPKQRKLSFPMKLLALPENPHLMEARIWTLLISGKFIRKFRHFSTAFPNTGPPVRLWVLAILSFGPMLFYYIWLAKSLNHCLSTW